ncbi:hypothetical protein KP003_14440 [Geomonas nitrogeniifigens]|uniref:hypothetical protein n=1 Tax=Geomonas diazotrophica TaxID=2843197 RepID=UPI001C2BE5B9|nr:hypothetical protein [Geomonas nitrogeniifigens]QXE85576.1 hypothetical protein KP003_14440 [Geomonas nitrogeniifigens]
MLTKEMLQEAITTATGSGLSVIEQKAFRRTAVGWRARPGCLTSYYSGGERVICGILLVLFWELYGSSQGVVIPDEATYENHPVDLVWPGAYYFLKALDNLTNEKAWTAIRELLPGKR